LFTNFHLLGVVVIFIASKYEDVGCLTMKKLLSKVCHNKFTQEQITSTEIDILQSLNFKIRSITLGELIMTQMNMVMFSTWNETGILHLSGIIET
jgi:hypothetical protein